MHLPHQFRKVKMMKTICLKNLIISSIASVCLFGCGFSGPLYLPKKEVVPQNNPTSKKNASIDKDSTGESATEVNAIESDSIAKPTVK